MERLGDELRGALRRVGVPDASVLTAVTAAWPGAVGPAIARSAWPLRISRDGTLHVAVESATWANELTLLAPEIHDRLAVALAPATACPPALRFAVGPVPAPGDDPATVAVPPPPAGPEEQAVADQVASAIEDPELREMVRRAATASLSRRRSDRPV